MKLHIQPNECYILSEEQYLENKDIIKNVNNSVWLNDIDVENRPYEEPADRDFYLDTVGDKFIIHRKFVNVMTDIKTACVQDDTDARVDASCKCGVRPVLRCKRVDHDIKPCTHVILHVDTVKYNCTILKNGDLLMDEIVLESLGNVVDEKLDHWFRNWIQYKACLIEVDDYKTHDWTDENKKREQEENEYEHEELSQKISQIAGLFCGILIMVVFVLFIILMR